AITAADNLRTATDVFRNAGKVAAQQDLARWSGIFRGRVRGIRILPTARDHRKACHRNAPIPNAEQVGPHAVKRSVEAPLRTQQTSEYAALGVAAGSLDVFDALRYAGSQHLEAVVGDQHVVLDADAADVPKGRQSLEIDQALERWFEPGFVEQRRDLIQARLDGHQHAGHQVAIEA